MNKWRVFFSTQLLCICLCFSHLESYAQAQQLPVAVTETPLHFLVFGDWGTGGQQQKDVAEAMARYADANRAVNPVKFAVLTGDNFYEKGVTSVDDPQWQIKFEQMYDKRRLNFPFIAALGNHDWGYNPVAQMAYAGTHPGTRWQMDGFWFKRQYWAQENVPNSSAIPGIGHLFRRNKSSVPLADIFFIDTDLFIPYYKSQGLADKQLAWLTDELKTSRARWQFVVGHHPLYSNGLHGRDTAVTDLRALLGPLFKQHGVDVYLAGHDHDLQRNVIPGEPTLFLVSGAAGKLRAKAFEDFGPFYASTAGYLAIRLGTTEMRGQFMDAKGAVLDAFRHVPVAALPVPAAVVTAKPAPVTAAAPSTK